MTKLSIEKVKEISNKTLLKIINRAKKSIEKSETFIDMCKEYGVEPDIINMIPVRFGDLDVSARTAHGIITLNYTLLQDGDFLKDYHYLLHEAQHYLQQCYGDKPTTGSDDGDYLKNKSEQEAFQSQVQYLDDTFGKNEAENYVEHVLNHHDKKGKERKKIKDILKEKIK
jgi:hypothetical protein